MNWNNLSKGICINECNEPLENKGRMVICRYCDFKIRMSKYQDLIKGKESKAYKKATSNFQRIKKYKDKMSKSIDANRIERENNLKRMLNKGIITQDEYNIKMSF